MMITERKCYWCKETRYLDEFHLSANDYLGHSWICKECKSNYDSYYRNKCKNEEKVTEFTQICTICDTLQPIINFSFDIGRNNGHSNTCKQCKRDYDREYIRHRTKEDPCFNIIRLIRSRIRDALNGKSKSAHTIELLGFVKYEDIKNLYLPWLQFTADMNGYKNFNVNKYDHNKFNIDHIIPVKKFNILDPNQQMECFYFMNTQILNKDDHKIKHNLEKYL